MVVVEHGEYQRVRCLAPPGSLDNGTFERANFRVLKKVSEENCCVAQQLVSQSLLERFLLDVEYLIADNHTHVKVDDDHCYWANIHWRDVPSKDHKSNDESLACICQSLCLVCWSSFFNFAEGKSDRALVLGLRHISLRLGLCLRRDGCIDLVLRLFCL